MAGRQRERRGGVLRVEKRRHGTGGEGAGQMVRVTRVDREKPRRGEDGKIDVAQGCCGKGANRTGSGQLEAEA